MRTPGKIRRWWLYRTELDDFIKKDFWLGRLIRDAEMVAAVVVKACQRVAGSVSEEKERRRWKKVLTLCPVRRTCFRAV